jgi:hypothetical protein
LDVETPALAVGVHAIGELREILGVSEAGSSDALPDAPAAACGEISFTYDRELFVRAATVRMRIGHLCLEAL